MRWLLHGALTGAVAEALKRHGHETRAALEVGLAAEAPPADVLGAANKQQLDVVTADAALATAPFEEGPQRPRFDRSLVFLNVAGDVEQDDAVDRLFNRYKRLAPGRLYTVTASRVKIRQLPSHR